MIIATVDAITFMIIGKLSKWTMMGNWADFTFEHLFIYQGSKACHRMQ